MPTPVPDQGHGIAIVFGTSGFQGYIVGCRRSGAEREDVETTHAGTTDVSGTDVSSAKTFEPSDLYDEGEVELDIHHDPNNVVPIRKPKETITITYPLRTGQATAANYAFSGYVKRVSEDYAPIDARTM